MFRVGRDTTHRFARTLAAIGASMLLALGAWRLGAWILARRTNGSGGAISTASFTLEMSGCGAVRLNACLVGKTARFRAIVPPPLAGAPIESITLGGTPIAPVSVRGRVIELSGQAHGTLEVIVGQARATLVVGRLDRPAWYSAVTAARSRGDLDTAEAHATEGLASNRTEDRALANGLLARVALRRGQVDRAVGLFREAIALGKEAQLLSESADDAFALSFLLHQRARRFGEARAVLDDIALGENAPYADGTARLPLYRAQLAWELGDIRTALRLLETARARAELLGHVALTRAVGQVRAMVLCHTGSLSECRANLAAAEHELDGAEGVTPCERVEVAVSLGFADLASAIVQGKPDAELGAADERALAVVACPDTHLRGVALEHLALGNALKKKTQEARARLEEAKRTMIEPRLSDTLMWADVDARIAMAEGRFDAALEAFAKEERLARAADRKREVWQALVGRADVLEAMGRTKEAVAAHLDAERSLDDQLLVVPLADGRAAVAAESEHVTARAIELSLRAGDPRTGLLLARSARARVARSIARGLRVEGISASRKWEEAVAAFRAERDAIDREAAADWTLSAANLAKVTAARKERLALREAQLDDALSMAGRSASEPTPDVLAPGELGIVFAEVPEGVSVRAKDAPRWIAFAFDQRGVTAARLPNGTRDDSLLAPFHDRIANAQAIRVFASGSLAQVDFHALPFDGAPLVAHAPVAYPLDLGARPGIEGRADAMLVVADPTGDLVGARAEGRAVASRGAATNANVVLLEGGQATSERVREALESADTFHYSGHGSFAGRAGTASALPLASGGALTLSDVLALRKPPALVVLSGCETARDDDGRERGIGLAHAFIVAGARSVIAPSRVVTDTLAHEIVIGLAEAPSEASAEHKLQFSQLRARSRGLTGWESFRLVVR